MLAMSRKEEYERLVSLIHQWNVDHYDIFELSQPNEDLEFHGVVRFFFQGGIGASVITKCIRVSSTASTREVIDVLIEKFRPDMRMLTQNKYALYEVHVNGEERRLADDEKPLIVQLNWGKDVREGRFLLRHEDHPTVRDPALGFDKSVLQQDQDGFKRKLSKRERKEKRKRGKEKVAEAGVGEESVANKLYEQAPETSFTRSISNPEAVMRRRRQQKLEKKLAQINTAEGGSDSGGTLKIYGESLRPDVPYKTLFLSTADPASAVVKEAMEKYGLEKEDAGQYCLVEVLLPLGGLEYHGQQRKGDERVLDDNECPLAIVIQHARHRAQGHIIFQLRRRSSDLQKRQKPRSQSHEDLRSHLRDPRQTQVDMLPFLLEVNVRGKPKQHILPLNVTEVVNMTEVANNKPDYAGKHFLQLSGPDIQPRHCVVAHTDGIVTLTPNSPNAETYVEGQRIFDTTMLKHGMTVQFGRDRLYRFLDPRFEELPKQNHVTQKPVQQVQLDMNGQVAVSTPRFEAQQWQAPHKRNGPLRSPTDSMGRHGTEDLLPASLEYYVDAQDRLLQAVVLDVDSQQLQFKLAPTYSLYLAVRHLLSTHTPVSHRGQLISEFVVKTAKLIQQSIQAQHNDPSSLSFWMANASEVLHMFKQDQDVGPVSFRAQEMLAEAVQTAFHHLVRCLQADLQRVMPAFLDPSEDSERENNQQLTMGRATLSDVLDTLSAAMTLMRRCRVNAALTIQLFSQLFHFINMWLFNILVSQQQLQLCTRAWGIRLKRRLGSVEAWAEKQGLELAADCHLCRIIQAAHLLQAPKATSEDCTNISSTCFKLNSLQMRTLLVHYIPEPNEPPVMGAFIERVVSIAENMADELIRTEGREVRQEEDNDLHLPFLLPEDGYSCETIRGMPSGLPEFLRQLEGTGLCRFTINGQASGSWTVYMEVESSVEGLARGPGFGLPAVPEILNVSFSKVNGSVGLSIVAALGEGQSQQGIYIKSVVEGGAAALDGRLEAGDQLLEVDGKSLIGLSQDKAAELMTKTGQVVRLKVAKRAVVYHNLGSLFSQPSPGSQPEAHTQGPVRNVTEEGPPPPYNGNTWKMANGGQMRAPSTGNLTDMRPIGQLPPYGYQRDNPRSKSTSNLHVDTSSEPSDSRSQLKPAQSLAMLYPTNAAAFNQYPQAEFWPDYRPNDYENQPNVQTGDMNHSFRVGQAGVGYNHRDPQQSLAKQAQGIKQYPAKGYQQSLPQKTSDRSSLSSRTSSASTRDLRPMSSYYDPHSLSREGIQNLSSPSRPRSEDVGSKLKDWQSKFEDPRASFRHSPAENSPPYTNIGSQSREPPPQPTHNPPPKPPSQDRIFIQSNPPHNQTNNAYNLQPNLYENTPALQNNLPHSLHQPQGEASMKPSLVAVPQKSQTFPQHTIRADGRPTRLNLVESHPSASSQPSHFNHPHVIQQPAFQQPIQPQLNEQSHLPHQHRQGQINQQDFRFGSDIQNLPEVRNGNVHNYQNFPQSGRFPDSRNTISGSYQPQQTLNSHPSVRFQQTPQQPQHLEHNHNTSASPHDTPGPSVPKVGQDLGRTPYQNNFHSGAQSSVASPQDLLLEMKLAEEQQKLFQQLNVSSQFIDQRPNSRLSPSSAQPGSRVSPSSAQPQSRFSPNSASVPLAITSQASQYQVRQPPNPSQLPAPLTSPVTAVNGQPSPQSNYQNISFAVEPRTSRPASQKTVSPLQKAVSPSQPLADSYNSTNIKAAGFQAKSTLPMSRIKAKSLSEINTRSAWDRDAKEKAEEQEQEELFRSREQEIAELESRHYLSPQDQDKLRKLKTEYEFQRRVREIVEKGDYEYEDDEEFAERYYNRERIIQMLKEDLEKSWQRIREFEASQQRTEISREQDRLQTLERRLEMYEKDREEQRLRMQKKQERRVQEHQDQVRQQRETRERQRQNYEEHKRQLMREEEKLNQRRQEELNKRKQFERERRQELQDKREAEEMRMREEIRREEEELLQQQLAKERQQKLEQNRPILVQEEKRRLDSIGSSQAQDTVGYSPYANVESSGPPPPPERKSSYDTFNQHQLRASFRSSNDLDAQFPPFMGNSTGASLPSALKNSQPSAKKSVSFNTDMNTYKDRTPNNSGSFRSASSSQSSLEHDFSSSNLTSDQNVFESNISHQHNLNSQYETSKQSNSVGLSTATTTPSVIGTQEFYRDPRSRIEAKIASQSSSRGPSSTDRMSFRDKMKYFAKEAGEDTIKLKPKSSKTLREIESQLNGL